MESEKSNDCEPEPEGAEEHPALSPEEQQKRKLWDKLQNELKPQVIAIDSDEVCSWRTGEEPFANLQHVAGVDISFDKEHPAHACAMLVIIAFPRLEVVHVCSAMVEMTEPYIPGYLAFREVGFLQERLDEVKQNCPELFPQVLLVDGNGILHTRGFGLASHLGVLTGLPCVGIGKTLFFVDGIEQGPEHKEMVSKELVKKGDHFFLRGTSGRIWGAALRTSNEAHNPVYVSIGHKISLETAVQLTVACSLKRVPEPVRQADIRSREVIRTHKKEHDH